MKQNIIPLAAKTSTSQTVKISFTIKVTKTYLPRRGAVQDSVFDSPRPNAPGWAAHLQRKGDYS